MYLVKISANQNAQWPFLILKIWYKHLTFTITGFETKFHTSNAFSCVECCSSRKLGKMWSAQLPAASLWFGWHRNKTKTTCLRFRFRLKNINFQRSQSIPRKTIAGKLLFIALEVSLCYSPDYHMYSLKLTQCVLLNKSSTALPVSWHCRSRDESLVDLFCFWKPSFLIWSSQ